MTTRPLEQRLGDARAETWKPAAGETLIGELTEVRWLSGYDGRAYPLLVIVREPDGCTVGVHAFHHVLRDELRAQRPRIGERLGIRYLGRTERYEAYKLAVDRDVPWDGPEPAREPSPPAATPAPAGDPEDIPF
jgi:hypothetical protein